MLMVVRVFMRPLPRGLDADGVTDNLTTGLGAMVMALREARRATGTKANRLRSAQRVLFDLDLRTRLDSSFTSVDGEASCTRCAIRTSSLVYWHGTPVSLVLVI